MTTKTRVRVTFLSLAVGILLAWIVAMVWRQSGPDHDWQLAQAAQRGNELGTAKIHLQNLLSKVPDHDRGHEMMAEVLLAEAQAQGQPATFSSNPTALAHLVEAAKLRQSDAALQEKLLATYLEMGRLPEAVRVAQRLELVDKEHAEALFALAWSATRQRDVAAAEALFERLRQTPSRRVFQTAALATELYEATGKDQELEQTLSLVAGLASNLEPEKIALLIPVDRDAMCRLLVLGVERAADLATAQDRAAAALQGCEKLAAASLQSPAVLAGTASRILLWLDEHYPLASGSLEEQQLRRQLHDRAAAIATSAIDAGTAEPLVYVQVAQALFGRGDDEQALQTVRAGIAAAEKFAKAHSKAKAILDLHMLAARVLTNQRAFDAAQPHVEALLANAETAGWGHLLTGTSDFHAGKLEKALAHFLRAERSLGGTLYVRAALANAYLALRQWPHALDNLASLQTDFQRLDAESGAWAKLQLGSGAHVRFGLLQAHLALNQWDAASRQLATLQDTEFESRATALAATYLWQKRRPAEALNLISEAAGRAPGDALLLRLQADMLQLGGKADEADELVEQAVDAAPDDLAIQLVWCQRRIAQGEAQDAVERIAELEARLDSPQDQLSLKVHGAQALLAAGDPAGAAATLEAVRHDPRFATAAGLLGAAANLQQLDLPAAAQALQAAQEIGPQHGLVRFLAGQLALANGDYQAAIDELGEVIDITVLREQAGRTLMQTLQLMSASESPAAAEAKVDQLLEHSPQHPILLMAKADLQIQQNQFNAGIALLRDAQRLQPEDPTATLLAAVAWLQRNRPESALAELRQALTIAPQHTTALLLASQASLTAQRNQEAYNYASAALAVNPGLWQAELLQAESLRGLKQPAAAAEILTGLIDGQQKPPAAFAQLADLHRTDQQLDKALEVCRAGRAALPDDFSLEALEVALVAATGDLDDARRLAEEAICESTSFEKCLELAAVFARGRHFPEAQHWGLQALSLADQTQSPHAHLLLGKVVLHLSRTDPDPGLVEQARDHFAAVVAAWPTHVDGANNLAWLLATEFHQPPEAVQVLANLLVDKDDAAGLPVAVLDTIGVVYRQADRGAEVEPLFKQALQNRPNHPTLLFHLGMVQAAIGKREFAVYHLQQALHHQLAGEEAEAAQRELASLAVESDTPE